MKHFSKPLLAACCITVSSLAITLSGCSNEPQKPAEPTKQEIIEHGKYLVLVGGCNDCHSPKKMTPQGPVIDETRILSGSPSDMKLPAIDPTEVTPGKWYLGSSDLTAWVGPWGISYAANLTPDSMAGTGAWTEELFLKILRTGKFMGIETGRPIMPPMPWDQIKQMKDEDLKAIFAYLQSIPAISNNVHAYVPPNEIASMK